jgi:hypothetical protein
MNNNQKLYSQINPSKILLRGMGIYLLITSLSLVLGIAFFLICIGLIHIVIWYANYWEPAKKVLLRALNISPSNQNFIKILPLNWYRLIFLALKAGIIICSVYLGCRILLTQGFLSQNIIYWFLKN